ncbi:unnamed protein product, partial [Acidithrix sp. C25]
VASGPYRLVEVASHAVHHATTNIWSGIEELILVGEVASYWLALV